MVATITREGASMGEQLTWQAHLTCAGPIHAGELDLPAPPIPPDRQRHLYGRGPFARLKMPTLPGLPGLYVWSSTSVPLYVGQTTGSLRSRLGSNGYSTVSAYNTLARQPGRTNGGQQTNCRINGLANAVLAAGESLKLWYQTMPREHTHEAESRFMRDWGLPPWNRRDHR
jgi:hypothetical protein